MPVPDAEAGPVDLASLRRRYLRGTLDVAGVDPDPVGQVRRWLAEAHDAGIVEPNAMVLATAGASGAPSARTVLLKGLDERGFAFFTQLRSAKGTELAENPRAALVFPWHAMDRQVVVAGAVVQVPRGEVATYFASRPHGSRLAAWASHQSQVVADRATLDAAWEAALARWPEGSEVPLPEHWGGYRVVPASVELWQGRESRLHDRLRYRRAGETWVIERVAP
jgi:pyridoxamine 5'-phosphate oxidase